MENDPPFHFSQFLYTLEDSSILYKNCSDESLKLFRTNPAITIHPVTELLMKFNDNDSRILYQLYTSR